MNAFIESLDQPCRQAREVTIYVVSPEQTSRSVVYSSFEAMLDNVKEMLDYLGSHDRAI
jgi:hypothetical protein